MNGLIERKKKKTAGGDFSESWNVGCTLVDHAAVLPDLAVGACQWCNVTHIDHSCHEISEEYALAANV